MSTHAPISFTGLHIEVTDPLREYANKRFEKLTRHFDKISRIEVTFEVIKLTQIARANVTSAGKQFNAQHESNDMYESIDLLVDKLDRQMKEHRHKETEH